MPLNAVIFFKTINNITIFFTKWRSFSKIQTIFACNTTDVKIYCWYQQRLSSVGEKTRQKGKRAKGRREDIELGKSQKENGCVKVCNQRWLQKGCRRKEIGKERGNGEGGVCLTG